MVLGWGHHCWDQIERPWRASVDELKAVLGWLVESMTNQEMLDPIPIVPILL